MPIPEPSSDESRSEFIERCMNDSTMEDEFPDRNQRLAVCESRWSNNSEVSSLEYKRT